ncbi:uncharacterized protein LOC128203531 [Mya arenaria]|uniref:uncharacterized protein LOC128203531 n=1 Tax=Mya arenaria TaxID=6604 RepID=UPI0022E58B8D|nr:uncharacterized protein LOC128203531 [Mya arenaria]
MFLRRKIKALVFIIGVVAIVLVFGRVFDYVMLEFIFVSHANGHQCKHCLESEPPSEIPRHLHQVFFFETSDTVPENLVRARDTCLGANPGYRYTLWNKTSINELIDQYYPDVRRLYDSYDHWVKRADVARYLVVHHMGGWYLDMDIECKKGFDILRDKAKMKHHSIVVRRTEPVGFSNDFIGASPRHSFMAEVISSLLKANIWFVFPYPSTVLVTGPTYFWGRYLHFTRHDQFLILSNYTEYLGLIHGSSWHSWDGIIIWYFFNRAGFLILLILLALGVLGFFVYRRKLRSIRTRLDFNKNWLRLDTEKRHVY